jgi:formamidopyrimidine-DNA glycosylase
MFELPEFVTLANQINRTLQGKTIRQGCLGNSPHKFVWYNRSHDEFAALTAGKTIGKAWSRGKWLFIPFEPGYIFLMGECGGRALYHASRSNLPAKYHLLISFEDGAHFSVTTQMWGALELYESGLETERQYVKDMRPVPLDPAFNFEYFNGLIDSLLPGEKRSVKALLTQEQLIPGIGNAIAQDIQFNARLHPRRPLSELDPNQRKALFEALIRTLQAAVQQGGRYDEVDLFNQPGGYVRLMDKNALERPCPVCGGAIEKFAYLGGSCYVCPVCQK